MAIPWPPFPTVELVMVTPCSFVPDEFRLIIAQVLQEESETDILSMWMFETCGNAAPPGFVMLMRSELQTSPHRLRMNHEPAPEAAWFVLFVYLIGQPT